MSIFSSLIDRVCLAIVERGERARLLWGAERAPAPQRRGEDTEFRRFQAIWPYDPTESPLRAKIVFLGLSDAEQRRAIQEAPAYLRDVRATRGKPMHASIWLQSFAEAA